MSKWVTALLATAVMVWATAAPAATVYVDAANTSGIEDGSAANPFNTVVEGLDAAAPGDTVSVAPGIYYGNLDAKYQVTLVSQQGPKVTIIDGLGSGYAVNACFLPYVADMTIDGFTFANSNAGVYACTYWRNNFPPVITVRNSIFRDMHLAVRASILSRVTVENTVITNVHDAFNAIWCYTPYITNVTIDNATRGLWAYQFSGPIIRNTSMTNVSTAFALNYYISVSGSHNNIWNYETYLEPAPYPVYLNLTDTISADPLFVDPPGDYRLQAGSPLIDAGVDVGLPYAGAAPDIGAYESDDLGLPQQAERLATSFAEAPVEIYRNPGEQRRHALYQKLSAVLNQLASLEKGNSAVEKTRVLNGCLHKLQNDILAKTDGNNGGSGANDWITDPDEKTEFYNHVAGLIARIREEIDAITGGN